MRLARIALSAVVVLALCVGAGAAAPGDAAGRDGAESGQAGPPDDLPGPVPDFVEGILHTIQQFVAGSLDGALGPSVSDDAGSGASNGGNGG